uniref:Col_cuticle_N domain-containing protein n=1 Tax=Steinernema glaseri TaxID=37863 RepID=A0A1I7XXW2_9BILA
MNKRRPMALSESPPSGGVGSRRERSARAHAVVRETSVVVALIATSLQVVLVLAVAYQSVRLSLTACPNRTAELTASAKTYSILSRA